MSRRQSRSTLFPYTTLFRSADIMKIAMIHVFNKLKEEGLDARLILQIHDELLIECKLEQKEKIKQIDRKSTRLNSSHVAISYAVFCLKTKTRHKKTSTCTQQ